MKYRYLSTSPFKLTNITLLMILIHCAIYFVVMSWRKIGKSGVNLSILPLKNNEEKCM